MQKRNFLNEEAPANYVAGLGRGRAISLGLVELSLTLAGATGFTTRSDIGPAREGPSEEAIKAALARRAEQLGQPTPTAYGAKDKKDEEDDDDRFQDPENEVGLFASGAYDEDDDEADRIYQQVDERMQKRRKARRYYTLLNPMPTPTHLPFHPSSCLEETRVYRVPFAAYQRTISRFREAREKAEREEYERKNPKIQAQFADLKRAMGEVTDEEWANIPEVGDLTGRNRRARQALRQKFYAVPDSVIAGAAAAGQMGTTVQDGADTPMTESSGGDATDGTMTNFAEIGAAKNRVLQVRLDQAAGTSTDAQLGSASTIDPKGYLTSLNKSVIGKTEAEVGDIKRVRVLLESVIKTNPTHAPGWIAAARLEEVAGKMVQARSIIARGCEHCPKNEDVWLESMRMNETHNAKIIVAQAVKENPKYVRLWVEAMKLESDLRAKKKVIRKALDVIPNSVVLWKEAVKLEENPEDAKVLLARAVELVPLSVELWLALARLETAERAQAVLNKARKTIPTSHEIWLAAARLQEQQGSKEVNVFTVMRRAVASLAKEQAMPKREDWLAEAEKCEDEGFVMTCQAIINETLGWQLDEDDDRKKIWTEDAASSIARGKFETARAIYAYALRVFYNKKSLWRLAADLEKNHGTKEALWAILEKAVEACPQSEVLWMMLAKEKLMSGDLDGSRIVLGKAFLQNPNNEDIWLAAVKLESEHGSNEKARELLEQARAQAGTARVWIKSVAFERNLGNTDAALELAVQGLQEYPKADKLWMMKGQIFESKGKVPGAREAYSLGTKACPQSIPLWLLASRLEESAGVVVKARSILDRARLANPKNAILWCESVRVERRANNLAQAKTMMARALQECPNSGLLWSESIWYLEPRTQRKPRMVEAMRKVDNDPALFVTVARNFWYERKLDKALNWFEKAIVADSDIGDTWAWYYKFLLQHGTEEKRAEVVGKCVAVEPRHGEIWAATAKEPVNVGKSTEEILQLVVANLE